MKKLLLSLLSLSTIAFGQIYTSTNDGNFFSPLNWSCFCVPANGDSLVINHDMQLTASIYYTSGEIKIGPNGSLTEDGTDRDVWVAGGSLVNNGVFDCYRLYLSAGSFVNTGTSVYFDSLWNQAAIVNSGIITVYDILNDQTASFNNSGDLIAENNFNNQGGFLNNATAVISVGNGFSNCNIQSLDAMFINDGKFCIENDFTNCIDDTLAGSGYYYVGGASSNFGVFDGTFEFNTPTGALGFNSGTIDPSVTFNNNNCDLGVEETQTQFAVYPNPASSVLYIDATHFSFRIFDLAGKLISQGSGETAGVDVSSLAPGIYSISIVDVNGNTSVQRFVKE
jgi:hypothetical protein